MWFQSEMTDPLPQLAFDVLGVLEKVGQSKDPTSDLIQREAENPCVHMDQPRDMLRGSATAEVAQAELVPDFVCLECMSKLSRSASLVMAGIS